jgi:hypothetical protein
MSNEAASILDLILPTGTSQYFTITACHSDDTDVYITLEEKDEPPTDQTVLSKGFHDITITDFPIRGKRTLLTFRRRYWKVVGQKELLKRDIPLTFPGTQLATEFAHFLKDDGGRGTILAGFYRKMSAPPSQRF